MLASHWSLLPVPESSVLSPPASNVNTDTDGSKSEQYCATNSQVRIVAKSVSCDCSVWVRGTFSIIIIIMTFSGLQNIQAPVTSGSGSRAETAGTSRHWRRF